MRTSNTTALTTCICVMNVQHRHGTCKQGELREGLVEMRTGAQPHGYHRKLPAMGESAGTRPGCRLRWGRKAFTSSTLARHHIIHHPKRSVQNLYHRNVKSFDIQTSLQRLDISYSHSPLAKKKICERDVHGRTCASGDDRMTGVNGVKTFEGYANARGNDHDMGARIGGKLCATGAHFPELG